MLRPSARSWRTVSHFGAVTAADGAQYLLPEGLGIAEASGAVGAHLAVESGAASAAERMFYDTFDGRLHAAGLVVVHADGRLALVDGTTYAEHAGADYAAAPERVLALELPAGPLRAALEPIVEVRALTPIARVSGRRRALRVLNDDAKTVVRLALEAPAVVVPGRRRRVPLQARVRVVPVRGYAAELERVRRTLERELGVVVGGAALHDEAVAATGGVPGGVSSKPAVALRPDQRTDSAAAAILAPLIAVIEANVPGTLADVDSEFLHDLRVAVRRSRSLQRQLRGAFPPRPLERFRAEFRWLQLATGPARDLDVYTLELRRFGDGLPDLGPLRGVLEERRRLAHRRMGRALRSIRAKRLLADWPVFLEGLVDAPEDDRPAAAQPIREVAAGRIRRVYRRMVDAGAAIDDTSRHEALHDLRKQGKELRYLLEFFADLYPAGVVKPMVKTLKSLQDTLGRFQDREVQAAMLRGLRDDVVAVEGGAAALMAMGLLVERLETEQAEARAEFAERFAAFAAKPQRRLVKDTFG
jgi:CHAD domain-containing protein